MLVPCRLGGSLGVRAGLTRGVRLRDGGQRDTRGGVAVRRRRVPPTAEEPAHRQGDRKPVPPRHVGLPSSVRGGRAGGGIGVRRRSVARTLVVGLTGLPGGRGAPRLAPLVGAAGLVDRRRPLATRRLLGGGRLVLERLVEQELHGVRIGAADPQVHLALLAVDGEVDVLHPPEPGGGDVRAELGVQHEEGGVGIDLRLALECLVVGQRARRLPGSAEAERADPAHVHLLAVAQFSTGTVTAYLDPELETAGNPLLVRLTPGRGGLVAEGGFTGVVPLEAAEPGGRGRADVREDLVVGASPRRLWIGGGQSVDEGVGPRLLHMRRVDPAHRVPADGPVDGDAGGQLAHDVRPDLPQARDEIHGHDVVEQGGWQGDRRSRLGRGGVPRALLRGRDVLVRLGVLLPVGLGVLAAGVLGRPGVLARLVPRRGVLVSRR